ncbi:MAG: TRAP transporter substrate-binding protein DctP [Desulfobacterales bacterium]|jgi:TRAP-type C4-dicarboxylate transport system substrate-binding protein
MGRRRRYLAAALCGTVIFALVDLGMAERYLWQIALEEIEGSMQHAYVKKFVEVIEANSAGDIRCQIHPYGDLGTSGDITRLLQEGDLQFAFQSPGHLGAVIPEVQVFSIHYLFPTDSRQLETMLRQGPNIRRVLGKYYRKHRMELLSIIEEGWQIWTANKAIRRPADFNGVTFRVMSSPLLLTAYRLYGAYAITVPYSEIYGDLELGRIDAETQPFFAIQEMKFYEVQDYMINARQLPFIATFVANRDLIDGLPEVDRNVIRDAVAAANDHIFDLEARLNAERYQMIMKAKPSMQYIELTEAEIDVFRQKAEPLREKYLEMGGEGAREVLDAVIRDKAWAETN